MVGRGKKGRVKTIVLKKGGGIEIEGEIVYPFPKSAFLSDGDPVSGNGIHMLSNERIPVKRVKIHVGLYKFNGVFNTFMKVFVQLWILFLNYSLDTFLVNLEEPFQRYNGFVDS